MKVSNKTILITGGGSGIGLEAAKLFSAKGNKVLIVGRNGNKLEQAATGLKNVYAYSVDITKEDDVEKLVEKLTSEYSDLSVLVNNAATAYYYHHGNGTNAFDKAAEEMLTNYLSVIRLNEKLLPLLKQQPEAAIVNVSSIAALAPNAAIPSYSDSKAALHSYTLTLRNALAKNTAVHVFELMPPLVKTNFSKDIGGLENGMPSLDVAQALIDGLENDVYEIHVGLTKTFHDQFFPLAADAFLALNKARNNDV